MQTLTRNHVSNKSELVEVITEAYITIYLSSYAESSYEAAWEMFSSAIVFLGGPSRNEVTAAENEMRYLNDLCSKYERMVANREATRLDKKHLKAVRKDYKIAAALHEELDKSWSQKLSKVEAIGMMQTLTL